MPGKKPVVRYICVGSVQKPHALKGELKAVLNYPLSEKKKIKTLYIGDQRPVPHPVEQLHPIGSNLYILKLSDCNDRNAAEEIAGSKIHILKEDFETYFESDDASDLIGYVAFAGEEELGVIEDVFKFPQQYLAQLFINGKEVLIPLNDSTISGIDKRKKALHLTLPDGLLEAQ